MGSHGSGEELISGETNSANALTAIVADSGSFAGAVFLVTPSGDLSVGPAGPAPVHAIMGFGYQGGVGVIGRGDQQDPPFRPGLQGLGTGGHGVKGVGGSGDAVSNSMETHHPDRQGKFKPGVGVLGIGGYWIGPDLDTRGRRLRGFEGGPGVVGIGGGNESETPYDHDAEFEKVKGVGVFGRAISAAGGNFESSNQYGVVAIGRLAGGFFKSPSDPWITAQIHLDPQVMSVPEEVKMELVGHVNPAKVDQLPREGRLGDLLLTTPPGHIGIGALLWLCVQGGGVKERPAVWRQVLLSGAWIEGRK